MSLVTKTSLIKMLENENSDYVKAVIGRALVALFKRQTEEEQNTNSTKVYNNIGFAGCDAYTGTLTAKYYMKHGTLQDWQVDIWTCDWRGSPRISKYWKQLNEIAESKNKSHEK